MCENEDIQEIYRRVLADLNRLENVEYKKKVVRFFKTGKGEYAEEDHFLGLRVPQIRRVAKKYSSIPLDSISLLLSSIWHESRFCALCILIDQFNKASESMRRVLFQFYMSHIKWVNNWDLVDLSAPAIVGVYLLDKDKSILLQLAKGTNLWEQRIAIVSTLTFIRAGLLKYTITLAKIYLEHTHDLIHKATGWMLREIGKKDRSVLLLFLDKYAFQMPRTMLRYSIEHLSKEERTDYLTRIE